MPYAEFCVVTSILRKNEVFWRSSEFTVYFGTFLTRTGPRAWKKKDIQQLMVVRKEWLDSGPYGKFRHTVLVLRDTPQRRDEWAKIAGNGILEEFR
jgi:hypothetical protein